MGNTPIKTVSARRRIWTPLFFFIFFVGLGVSLCGQGSNVALPIYFNNVGVSATYSGLQMAAYTLPAAVTCLLCGVLIDRYSRRSVMLIGTLIFFCGALLPLIAPSIVAIFICRIMQGVGLALSTTAASSAAADVLPEEHLGEGMGYYNLGQSLALALGPMCTTVALQGDNLRQLYICVGTLSLLTVISATRCRYEKPEHIAQRRTQRTSQPLHHLLEPGAIAPSVVFLTFCLACAVFSSYSAVYGETLGVITTWPFYTIAAGAMVCTRIFGGHLIDRYRPLWLLLAALVAELIFMLMMSTANSAAMFYLSGVFHGIGYGVGLPLLCTVAVRRSPEERHGAANATFYLSLSVGFGVGGAAWGWVIEHFGYGYMYIGASVALAVAALLGILLLRSEPAPH